eukprot:m.88126 g.88126  ORF g.88126 m.88126 type:complete len:403 (-) comp13146_c0_seq1:93-1301(-)
MAAKVQSYMYRIETAIQSLNAEELRDHFSHRVYGSTLGPALQNTSNYERYTRNLMEPYRSIASSFLEAVHLIYTNKSIEAFKSQKAALAALREAMKSSSPHLNWLSPVMETMVRDLRIISYSAADETQRGDEKDYIAEAYTEVQKCFTLCINDRSEEADSKKWSTLMMLNEFYNIATKLNKYWQNVGASTERIKHQGQLELFKTAHRVEYLYNIGRKALFDANYKEADVSLSEAFRLCHKDSRSNKALILTYLIPVKLLVGHMPSNRLLSKYGMHQYMGISNALRDGNLLKMKEELTKNQAFFVQWGLFLIITKLRFIAYRNLFKKVHLAILESSKKYQLPLKALLTALTFCKENDVDLDEIACIVANLIAKKYIKGYISHEHGVVVLSKKQAFPPLSSVNT